MLRINKKEKISKDGFSTHGVALPLDLTERTRILLPRSQHSADTTLMHVFFSVQRYTAKVHSKYSPENRFDTAVKVTLQRVCFDISCAGLNIRINFFRICNQ